MHVKSCYVPYYWGKSTLFNLTAEDWLFPVYNWSINWLKLFHAQTSQDQSRTGFSASLDQSLDEGWGVGAGEQSLEGGVSVDIGCMSTHRKGWVWAGNTMGGGCKMMVVGGLDGYW